MLAKFLEHDHGQKAGTGPSPRHGMERGRRLADLLAVPATELLADRFDHLPLSGHAFQGASHVLAELAQSRAAAAAANRRRIDHHPLARKVLGEGLALGPLTREAADVGRSGNSLLGGQFIFRGRCLSLFEGQSQLVNQPRGALGLLAIELTRELGDLKFLMRNQGIVFRRLGICDREFGGGLQSFRPFGRQCCFQSSNILHGDAISFHATQ